MKFVWMISYLHAARERLISVSILLHLVACLSETAEAPVLQIVLPGKIVMETLQVAWQGIKASASGMEKSWLVK